MADWLLNEPDEEMFNQRLDDHQSGKRVIRRWTSGRYWESDGKLIRLWMKLDLAPCA